MPPKKRVTRTSAKAPAAIPEDQEVFTSGTDFDFNVIASPRMTRARRASMSFDVPLKQFAAEETIPAELRGTSRRRSLAPTIATKKPASPKVKLTKKMKLPIEEEFVFDSSPSRDITPNGKKTMPRTTRRRSSMIKILSPPKGIEPSSFYSSPVKSNKSIKKSNSQLLVSSPQKGPGPVSPVKSFSKRTTKTMTQEDIEASLMSTSPTEMTSKSTKKTSRSQKDLEASLMAEFDCTPTNAKIKPKTFETDIPLEKVKPRRREVDIKSPVVKAFEKKVASPVAAKTPKTTKTVVKTAPTPKAVVKTALTPVATKTPKAKAVVNAAQSPAVVENRGIKRPHEAVQTSNKKLKIAESSPRPLRSKTPAKKLTPLEARYDKLPQAGSQLMKKPLIRLEKVAAVTPNQVRPSDLLKRNMKKQVETAISAKVASCPDSSPYTMDTTVDGSPVFRKVEKETVVKQHLTGTPARASRTRKFGVIVQPNLLDLHEASVVQENKRPRSVNSSTPLRASAKSKIHPLEAVEATPIRPRDENVEQAQSPQPMLVTGGLAKVCAIM